MTSRSKFVVGTVNGKCVSYIIDKTPSVSTQDRSIRTAAVSAATSRSSNARPTTTATMMSHYDLKEAAKINGSVTLSQNQLHNILEQLERQHGSTGRQEAWISSASSYSGGEETSATASRIPSVPTTPGPQVHFEEPTRDTPDATLDTIATLSYDTEQVLNSPYARIKAAFTHTYDTPSYQIPSIDSTDVFTTSSIYHSDTNIDSTNNNPSQLPKSTENPSQSNSSYDYQTGMKPPLSLLEQKKLQWAKEREELEGLCAPWGRDTNYMNNVNREPIRVQYQSKPHHLTEYGPDSLPTITRDHITSPVGYSSEREWRDVGSVVSVESVALPPSPSQPHSSSNGYTNGSTHLLVPGLHPTVEEHPTSKTEDHSNKAVRFSARTPGEGEEHEEEGRPRWGDRGVGVGHLWEPSAQPSARLPSPPASSPGACPAWLERGLSRLGPSPDPSEPRNFLRGQNVPVEPSEMEERERKRQKALEHQQAIKQQLEERDRRRREEREQRLNEERKEEERVRREQELERTRMEQERQRDREARAAKHAASEVGRLGLGLAKQMKQGKQAGQKDADKPINLSPRIVDMSQRPRPDIAVLDQISQGGMLQRMQEVHIGRDDHRGNVGNVHNEMRVHRNVQELHLASSDIHPHQMAGMMSRRPEQGPGMLMLGQEVAVLLAPDLEERLLHSRAAREVATQTDTGDLQATSRCRRPRQQQRGISERPLWGAHRSSQRYIKQSDKDVYRQRGASTGTTPPRQQQHQQRRSQRATQDSTEESDRSPPTGLLRRRGPVSKSSQSRRCQNRSSGEDSPSPTRRTAHEAEVWSNQESQPQEWWNQGGKQLEPPPLQTPLLMHQPIDYFDIIFNPPVRTTSSPPVPAVAKKLGKQPDLFKQLPSRREPKRQPPNSPPVPAVAKKLQEAAAKPEGGASLFPSIADPGNKSAPPAMQSQGHPPGILPEIRQRELSSAAVQSTDILSQLSTLRRALQTKQNEWELRSETPFSDT